MHRLDVCALKVVICNYQHIFQRPVQNILIKKEELQRTANTLWNITRSIVLRDEPFGHEAIDLIGVLAYMESRGILSSHIIYDRRWITVLRSYDLITTTSVNNIIVHRLFYDLICVKNESIEMEVEVLRNCFKILFLNKYENTDIHSLMILWEETLKYVELVREFKSVGFGLCSQSYHKYLCSATDKDLSMERKTGEIFEGLFGATDKETIQLKCYELMCLCRLSDKVELQLITFPCESTPKASVEKCRQICASIETYVRSGDVDISLMQSVFHCESLAFEFLVRNESLSKDLMLESVALYKYICDKYKDTLNFRARLDWQDLIIKCLKVVPKVMRKGRMNLLKKLRNVLLSDVSFTADRNRNLAFQYDICHSLTETVFHVLSTEDAIAFKEELNEELRSLSIIWNKWAQNISGVDCRADAMPPIYFLPKIPKIFKNLINCVIKLERFEQISSVIELTDKIANKMCNAEKEYEYYRLLTSTRPPMEICYIIFKTVSTSQNLSHDMKDSILKQSVMSAKYILFWCVRTGHHLEFYSSEFDGYYTPQLHVIKCCVELNAFAELTLFYVEYEKLMMEYHSAIKTYTRGQREELVSEFPTRGSAEKRKTVGGPFLSEIDGEKNITTDMIEFGGLIIDHLKPREPSVYYEPLLQITVAGTRKYWAMVSRGDTTEQTQRIKALAMRTTEFCERNLGQNA